MASETGVPFPPCPECGGSIAVEARCTACVPSVADALRAEIGRLRTEVAIAREDAREARAELCRHTGAPDA